MSTIIKVSDFFENDIPAFILGAFFSKYLFTDDNKYIYTYGSFRKSTKITTKNIDYDKYLIEYLETINKESTAFPFWCTFESIPKNIKLDNKNRKGIQYFMLENNINISITSFYNKLYKKVVSQDWIYDSNLNENKKSFIRGFIELRGSIDTTTNYMPQDYSYNSDFEIRKIRVLIDMMHIPYNQLNINFRDLQNQYVTGISKRATQFRPDVWWYMSNIGVLNKYKAEIFLISKNARIKEIEGNSTYFYDDGPIKNKKNNFEDRLTFYINNIFNKNLSINSIKKLRNELGFNDSNVTSIRSTSLADLVRLLKPDECVGCKNKYDISDRSYIRKDTGRYFFEVHHVISIGNNKDLDDIDNMVKLCPACHRTLKKGTASRETQEDLIKEIYKNSPECYEFSKHFFDTDNYNEIINLTWQSLN